MDEDPDNDTGRGDANSNVFDTPGFIKTFGTFIENRWRDDYARANTLTDGKALKDDSSDHYLFYKENTNSVDMDLSGASGALPCVAIDTTVAYSEVTTGLGTCTATDQTWTAPSTTDWVIAVGEFEDSGGSSSAISGATIAGVSVN
jgi:hypothetical protein